MLVIIENEYEGSDFEEILDFDYQKTAEAVVSRVLSDSSCPYDAEVNILLTGLSEIEEINSEMRGIASPTDVLSFPMHEYEYQVPPQALWVWDDGQSMYPPNTYEPMVIYRGADCRFTPPVSETEEEGTLVLTIRTRDDRHVWHQTLTDLTTEIVIPADVTKDMKEGRH